MISHEPTTFSTVEQSPSIETNLQTATETDLTPNILIASSTEQLYQTPRAINQTRKTESGMSTPVQHKQDHRKNQDKRSMTKDSSDRERFDQPSFEYQSYNHDVLVIDTRPPKVNQLISGFVFLFPFDNFKLEPLSTLFHPSPMRRSQSSSPNPTPATLVIKSKRLPIPKGASQMESDDLASSANLTETTTIKTLKKHESKFFDDQRVEEVISKAPIAAHAILKVYFYLIS